MKKVEDLKFSIKNFIIKSLENFDEIISVSIPGSFEKKVDISIISDIDVVIIVKKLNKNLFNNIIKKFHVQGCQISLDDYSVIVNSTFGPLKFNDKKTVVFHVMIYDINGHREHVIKSPFTCYDWEKSKPIIGKSLSDIYTALPLQLNDLVSSRRSLISYIDDIEKENISYRKYLFKGDDVLIEKLNYKMDDRMKMEYIFHTIKFILLNMMKILKQKNLEYSELQIIKNFSLEGYDKRKIGEILNNLYLWKYKKNLIIQNTIKPIKKELFDLSDTYLRFVNKLPIVNFIRHKKTQFNDGTFLGIGRNPDIIDKIKFDDQEYELIYSSKMKRAISTAKLLNGNEIIEDSLINEIDYGEAEGMTYLDLIKFHPQIKKQWDLKNDPKFPSGENSRDVLTRLNKFLKKNILNTKIKKIGVVTHNVVIRILLSKLYKIELNLNYKFIVENCEIISFRVFRGNIIPQLNHDQRIKFRDNITSE